MATTDMTTEDFRAGIVKAMALSQCPIDTFGLEVFHDKSRYTPFVMRLQKQTLENMAWEYAIDRLDPSYQKFVINSLRKWWTGRKWIEGVMAARDFMAGPDDGVERPYQVHAAVDAIMAARGIEWDHVRRAVAQGFGRGLNDRRDILDFGNQVWANFRDVPDGYGDYRWRQGVRHINGLSTLPPTQWRMSAKDGTGLCAYIMLAPGIMWMGGAAPAIWLERDRFPQTIMTAARGRPVTDVIGMRELDIPGLTINGMRHDGARTVIQVSRVLIDVSTRSSARNPLKRAA